MKVKMIAIIMVLTFLVISLSACSKSTKEQNKNDNSDKTVTEHKENTKPVASMGRYMEKDIEFPKTEGNESIIRILQNAEKQFEVYTINTTDSGNEHYCYRETEDMTWEKSKPLWLNTSNLLDKAMVLADVCLDGEGRYYAIFNKYGETAKSMVFRSDKGDVAQSIDIAYLEEPVQNFDGRDYYPSLKKIGVLKNGNIVLQDMWNNNALLVFDSHGKKVDEIGTSMTQNFLAYDKYIITMNEEGNIILYNSETKSIDKTIEYSADSGNAIKQISYAMKEDGTLALGDPKGIHRLSVEGTLWETTVDGALNSMSMPSLVMNALFIKGDAQEEYYVTYADDKGFKLKKYIYDRNVSAVPEKEITVYSLMENSTIRQAISLFQSQNTNVKINYVVAISEKGESVVDYIRALNTELLSGNGADILVLDDLPVESYIEKGILTDISDIVNPLASSGEFIKDMLSNYHEDGKFYQIPIRFSVPIIVGKTDALSSSDSLENIVEYIRRNNNVPYAAPSTPEQLLKDYLALNMDTLFLNGKLQKEQLTSFLSNLKEVTKNIAASTAENAVYGTMTTNAGGSMVRRNSDSLFQGAIAGNGNEYVSVMLQINNVMDMMFPNTCIINSGLGYQTLGDRFIPKGLIGLNSTSKEGELAKQFIRFLLNKEIQDTNLYDGLPVLLSSLHNWFNEENPNIRVGINDTTGNMIIATWPEKDRREEYLDKILNVKKPIVCNQIIIDMIKEHALLYLTDQEDIEKATNAIFIKVDTYLAE